MTDLAGKRFGRLILVRDSGKRTHRGEVLWQAVCDCGREYLVRGSHVQRGEVKSCGCGKRKEG